VSYRQRAAASAAGAGRPARSLGAAVTHATFQPGQVSLGWQHELLHADPGLPPRRPVPPDPERVNPGWLAAQRRAESLISRPARQAAAGCLLLAGAVVLLGRAGWLNPALTGLGAVTFGGLAAAGAASVWRGRQGLKAAIAAENRRVTAARAVQERDLFAAQEEHAHRFRAWQSRERAFRGQALWYPVVLPGQIDRVDLAGGTMAGWSALLTSVGAPRLASGGALTILDLSEGAVAKDLVSLAGQLRVGPLVWVLPGDLPRFDLGVGLPAAAMADILTTSASADRAAGGGHDPAPDHSLLARLLEVLGDGAQICQVTAALRALAQVGDPREDVREGRLTAVQLDRITGLFGRGAADRVVIERAWALEARLRLLDRLGRDPAPVPPSRLRVVAPEPGGDALGNGVLAAYVTVALTHLLRQARPGRPWRHTVCLAGAQALPGELIDRLAGACEATRTGLVVAYRSIPPHVAQRLGRGNAALAVMRLGNAEDAKAASEQIGSQHRFVLSQLTDTVGASVSDTAGDSYTSTVGTAQSVSAARTRSQSSGRSQGRSRARPGGAPLAPRTGSDSTEASESRGTSDCGSLTDGISTSTSWGVTTSRAIGLNESLGRTVQRSREFLVEPEELQRLPPSAVIVSYASGPRRHVVLADANPAIATLPTVTWRSLDQARLATETAPPATPSAAPAGEPAAPAGELAGPAGSRPVPRVSRPRHLLRRPRGRWAGVQAAASRHRTSAHRRSPRTGAAAATDRACAGHPRGMRQDAAMATHIALLRGINVGGRNKVSMVDLRAVVAGLGHTDVATYIQSGNVLFTSDEADTEVLATALEEAIASNLGVKPAVIVLSRADLAQAARDNPYPDEPNPKMVHAVFFRGPVPAGAADAIETGQRRAAERGGGNDTARIVGRTLFLHTPDGFGRSELSLFLLGRSASPVAAGTARNWSTVTKLLALCDA